MQLLHEVLVGVNGVGAPFKTINDLLDLNWVSIGLPHLLWVRECDVFQTVNLAEAPEHRVIVLASAFHLVELAKVEFLERVQCEIVGHLILCEGLCGVGAQVVGDIRVRVESFEGLEEAEFAHNVLR